MNKPTIKKISKFIDHPSFCLLQTIHNIGNVLGQMGQLNDAERVYLDGVARQNRIETPSQKLLVRILKKLSGWDLEICYTLENVQ